MKIQYGLIVRTLRDLPCYTAGGVIAEGEEVTVGAQAAPAVYDTPACWWIQHRDGKKGVAYEDELVPV